MPSSRPLSAASYQERAQPGSPWSIRWVSATAMSVVATASPMMAWYVVLSGAIGRGHRECKPWRVTIGWRRTPFPERSEEHTSELQSLMRISYAVFCLKKKKHITQNNNKYHT